MVSRFCVGSNACNTYRVTLKKSIMASSPWLAHRFTHTHTPKSQFFVQVGPRWWRQGKGRADGNNHYEAAHASYDHIGDRGDGREDVSPHNASASVGTESKCTFLGHPSGIFISGLKSKIRQAKMATQRNKHVSKIKSTFNQ